MDTCPICFEDLSGKVKASPNACDHVFCLPCIEKWAKLGSFCPVDRKRFRKIVNLDSENFIQVKPRKRKRRKTVYDFSAKCEVCLKSTNANVLLLCDCCDLGYHMFCLNPPLKTVPAGLWFCPTCVSVESKLKKNKGISKEQEADLGNALLELQKINKCDIETTNTQDKKENADELINKEINVNKTRTVNNEECDLIASELCSKVASELKGSNVETNCTRAIATSSSSGTNQRESETKNSSECMIKANSKNEKKYIKCSPVQSELLYSNDLCLSKTQKDVSLLDDHLSQSDLYGNIKMAIVEQNVIQSMLDKSYTNVKNVHSSTCNKSLHGVRFSKKIPDISPTSYPDSLKIVCNENISQQSSSTLYDFSEDWMQKNAGHGDASNMNMSSPCCSTSADSNKGMDVSKARSSGILNTNVYQNEVSIEDLTIKNIGSGKKFTCAIKGHASSNSPNNCFFNFCQCNSLKQKVSSCNINELYSSPIKCGDKAPFLNSCEQENASKFGGNDDSNFMLNNFTCSKTHTNKDKSCKNNPPGVTQASISQRQNSGLSNIKSSNRKSETLTRSNHSTLNTDEGITFFRRNDLKHLVIRSDGSLYIDLSKGKNSDTENHNRNTPQKISESRENINFSSDDLNYCFESFNKTENIYQPNMKNSLVNFKCSSSKESKYPEEESVPKQLQECNSSFKSYKGECFNSQYVKVDNGRPKNYTCDKEESDFQSSDLSSRTDSNKTIQQSDLKYLSIKEDGTFTLDLPTSEHIKFEEKPEQKSRKTSNCEALQRTDLKRLRIRDDGTFFLDIA